MVTVRTVVLGSGQDGGSPQLGFDRPVAGYRTAASIALVTDSGESVLLDASPDLRIQQRALLDVDDVYARRTGNAFDAVYLTHAHMGHYTGLVHLGKEAHDASAVPCRGTRSMIEFLRANQPWCRIETDGNVAYAELGDGDRPIEGVDVVAIPVPHRAEHTDTVAFSIRSPRRRLLYVPDVDSWDDWDQAHPTVAGHDVALLDATFASPTELTRRDITEVGHPLVTDTIERFADLAAGRRLILTHLNHTNPVGDPGSSAAAAVRAAGFEVAFDGMVIEL